MIRLGLRLAIAGGTESRLRLAATAVGVGIGVMLLLLALTTQSAVQGRAIRSGWRSADADSPMTGSLAGYLGVDQAVAPDEALFLSVTDYHDGTPLTRAYVASLGPQPPVPPGLERLPEPGEVAVSPAMRRLLESTPDDQLDDRYPGRIAATIGNDGLAHPDERVALIGRTPDQLREVSSNSLYAVRSFGSLPSGYGFVAAIRLVLLIGVVLLLIPVIVFLVMATRVAAAQREQRLAAIRLAGATRLQTAIVAAVETGLAALAGSALGWVGYEAGRRVLAATVTFQRGHFFPEDVVVAPGLLLAVLLGVPVLAVLTTVASLRHVQVGPLGTTRRIRRSPSAWRAVPLGIGLGGQLAAAPLRDVLDRDVLDALGPMLVLLTLVGIVAIGPWLCLLAGSGVARASRRAPGLIAARRIASDPRATFRAVSGVALAAFVVTYSASLLDPSENRPSTTRSDTLRPGVVEVLVAGVVPEKQLAPLISEQAVVTRFAPVGGVVESCPELARVVTLSCSSSDGPEGANAVRARPGLADTNLPILSVYIVTDGTTAAENRVRSRAANLVPNAIIHTRDDRLDGDGQFFGDLERLQRVSWYFFLIVAACGFTVGMVAGVLERRRPFALLRASGLRVGELRQIVLLETVAAMLVTAAVSVGLGLTASYIAALFGDMTWEWPDAGVFTMVGVGVLAAVVLSTLTLPLMDAATRYDTVRYE